MGSRLWSYLLVGVLGIAPIWGQSSLLLKNRSEGSRRSSGRFVGKPKSRSAMRGHYLVELHVPPTPEMLAPIQNSGQKVVSYVPVNGFILSAEGSPQLDGLDVASVSVIEAKTKLSSEIAVESRKKGRSATRASGYVVEFHSDVSWEERRRLLQENGIEILDHDNLVGDQMLVRGTTLAIEAIAEWDEVSYIFPASDALMTGLPLIGCIGGETTMGAVGSLVQTVGEGWDGPGKGHVRLQVAYKAFTQKLSQFSQKAEIAKALAEWSRIAQIDFEEGNDPAAKKTIAILFGSGSHGDQYPFDGPGKVLAHTFYPAPPNPEPLAGDLHFDDAENWQVGQDVDVFSVALHELGHALGLAHSDVPGAVMYPYYRKATALTQEDITAIRGLYGTRESNSATPPVDTPQAPAPPSNPPSLPAPTPPPSNPVTPASTGLELFLVSPSGSVETTASSLAMNGTITGAQGLATVRWVTDRGMYGEGFVSAAGGGNFSWGIQSVRLVPGPNTVTVLVSDTSRKTVGKTVTVTVKEVADPGAAPRLAVTSASSYLIVTTLESIALSGSAYSTVGVSEVRWESTNGDRGPASGTAAWSVAAIPLRKGFNLISVTAADVQDRETTHILTVYRY